MILLYMHILLIKSKLYDHIRKCLVILYAYTTHIPLVLLSYQICHDRHFKVHLKPVNILLFLFVIGKHGFLHDSMKLSQKVWKMEIRDGFILLQKLWNLCSFSINYYFYDLHDDPLHKIMMIPDMAISNI